MGWSETEVPLKFDVRERTVMLPIYRPMKERAAVATHLDSNVVLGLIAHSLEIREDRRVGRHAHTRPIAGFRRPGTPL